ncbi:MAG: hypothetical protein D6785_08150 [Planctomycetota bacterium]|nr:MAG: hypothetical protein D6785_08150 [Planctomycetota bacterium]
MYDIGMVYKKNGQYYLAVDSKKLLTFTGSKPTICRIRKGLQKELSMSVKELCEAWEITVEYLDKVVAFYLIDRDKVTPSSTFERELVAV